MQHDRMSPDASGDQKRTNLDEDLQWQSAVLALVIEEDPHQLSEREIIREMAGEKPEFPKKDATRRAIEELVRAGLLRRCESMVLLTKPARHMASLDVA